MDESSKLAHLLQDNHKPLIVYGHMSPYMLVGMSGCTLFIIIFTRSLGTEVSIGT
jgi:hypothetical protein